MESVTYLTSWLTKDTVAEQAAQLSELSHELESEISRFKL